MDPVSLVDENDQLAAALERRGTDLRKEGAPVRVGRRQFERVLLEGGVGPAEEHGPAAAEKFLLPVEDVNGGQLLPGLQLRRERGVIHTGRRQYNKR